jgi:hypothetical protein
MTLRLRLGAPALILAAMAIAVAVGLLLPTGHRHDPADRSQIAVMELGRS